MFNLFFDHPILNSRLPTIQGHAGRHPPVTFFGSVLSGVVRTYLCLAGRDREVLSSVDLAGCSSLVNVMRRRPFGCATTTAPTP